MGSKNEPGQFDCYANALADEPMFVLLARDPGAPDLVEEWAVKRMRDIVLGIRPKSDLPMVNEAQRCAKNMREWRKQNDGAWRQPEPASEKECVKAVWSVRKTPEPVIDDDYPAENYYDVLCPDGAWRGAVAVSADDARETIQEEWKNEHPAPPAASLIAKGEMPLPALQPSKE